MADTKISGYTADTSPTSDDLTVTVNDPGGTPVNRKVTLGNLITKAHGLADGIMKVASGAMTVLTLTGDPTKYLDGTGAFSTPAGGGGGGGRTILTTNTSYYVRTDGSDSNNGLVNSSGGAWLTVQHGLNYLSTIDLGGYVATINIGAGTFSGQIEIPYLVGQALFSSLVISGAGNTTILTSSGAFVGTIQGQGGVRCTVQNVKITNTEPSNFGIGIRIRSGAFLVLSGVEFGACGYSGTLVDTGAFMYVPSGTLTFSANDSLAFWAAQNGKIILENITVAFGTRTFTTTMYSSASFIELNTVTFTGSVTGQRYNIDLNGVINTYGQGASYIPGNSSGGTSTGGQYV